MSQTTPSQDHPLLQEQDVIELKDIHFTETQTNSYQKRFRAFSTMQEYHYETILRHMPDNRIHRTTTVFNKKGLITNKVSQFIDNAELQTIDRKNVKTLINNYMMNKAHLERRTH